MKSLHESVVNHAHPFSESLLAAAEEEDKYLDRKLELENYFHRLMKPEVYDYQILLEEDGTKLHIIWSSGTRNWKVDSSFSRKFPYLKKVYIEKSGNDRGTLNIHMPDTSCTIHEWVVNGEGFYFNIFQLNPDMKGFKIRVEGERSRLFLGGRQRILTLIHPSNSFWCREGVIRTHDPLYLNKCIKGAVYLSMSGFSVPLKKLAQELDCVDKQFESGRYTRLVVNPKNPRNLERLGLPKNLKVKQIDIQ